ncbi:MAG: hypothetical protein AAGI25_16160 [Bacteroidota bacterium]
MLKTTSVLFSYDQNMEFSFFDIEIEACAGNLLVLGESGIDKTTLLHLITG